MEASNPLSNLADIHLPGGVSWWPPAFGWWVLLVILLAALAWAAIVWFRQNQRKQAMQAAIDELDGIWRRYKSHTSGHETTDHDRETEAVILLNGINALLRRVVIQQYPDTDTASLFGERWLAFLDSCDGSTHFSSRAGKVLGEASYRKTWDEDPAPVYKLAKAWIHRRYLLEKQALRQAEIKAETQSEDGSVREAGA